MTTVRIDREGTMMILLLKEDWKKLKPELGKLGYSNKFPNLSRFMHTLFFEIHRVEDALGD